MSYNIAVANKDIVLDPRLRGISAYISEVQKLPILTEEEEINCAKKFSETGIMIYLEPLVMSHLRLVVRMAREAKNNTITMEDLICEGNLGLVKAAHNFDYRRKVRFATYAVWWIKAAICEYTINFTSIIKPITNNKQRKLFFGLLKMKKQLVEPGNENPSHIEFEKLANYFDVSVKEVKAMYQKLYSKDKSLNRVIAGIELIETIKLNKPDQETILIGNNQKGMAIKSIQVAITKMSDLEKYITINRLISDIPLSLTEIGKKYSMSAEGIRHAEKRAISKIKNEYAEQLNIDSGKIKQIL